MNFIKSLFFDTTISDEEESNLEAHAKFRNSVPCQRATVGIENPKIWRYFDFGDVTKAPLVCIPPAGGSADVFFKLFNDLPAKGIRLIGVQSPGVLSHDQWIDSFNRFLNHIKIKKVHILGCGLGGFLALLYSRVYPDRVISTVLINSYSDNTELLQNTSKYEFAPIFVLRKIIYNPDENRLSDKNMASVNFYREHMSDLEQFDAYSSLLLQGTLGYIDKRKINTTTLTIIQSNDYSSFPPSVRNSLYDTFPSTFITYPVGVERKYAQCARFVTLKKGGDLPFISEGDEVALHVTVHLRRLEQSLLVAEVLKHTPTPSKDVVRVSLRPDEKEVESSESRGSSDVEKKEKDGRVGDVNDDGGSDKKSLTTTTTTTTTDAAAPTDGGGGDGGDKKTPVTVGGGGGGGGGNSNSSSSSSNTTRRESYEPGDRMTTAGDVEWKVLQEDNKDN